MAMNKRNKPRTPKKNVYQACLGLADRIFIPEVLFYLCFQRRGPVRSNSVMVRSISARAASAEERLPWARSLNSSGVLARINASSSVIKFLEYKSKMD